MEPIREKNMTEHRSIFRVPGYPHLLAARTTSSVILWVDFTLIFSLLSCFWHAGPTIIGVASALYGLPGLVLGPFFGRLADRHNPFAMLYCSYVARGLTSLLIVFAPSIDIFVLLVFLKGLGNLGAMPAEQVLARSILTKDQIVSNAGLATAIDQITKICAPLLGALMTQWYRPNAGFALSAMLAIVGLILLRLLHIGNRGLATNVANRPRTGKLDAMIDLLRRDPTFRHAFYAAVVQSAVLGLYDPLLALMLKAHGFPAATFGAIVSCTAAGAIFGAVIFRHAFLGGGGLRVIFFSLAGFGITVLAPGLVTISGVDFSLYLMLGLWAANGMFYALAAMSFGVIMQTQCPLETIGTVSTSARSIQLAALVLGPLIGALLARMFTLNLVFILSGILALAWGIGLAYKDRHSKRVVYKLD